MAASDEPASGPRVGLIGLGIVIVVAIIVGVMTATFASSLTASQAGKPIGNEVTDGITANATVINVDPLKTEMTIRLAMQPEGSYNDNGVLSRPVTLYYDSVDGTKQIDFKAGKPLGATDLSVPLLGDTVSAYPWDKYDSEIGLEFTTVSDEAAAAAKAKAAQEKAAGSTTTTTTAPPTTSTSEGEPSSTTSAPSSTTTTAPGTQPSTPPSSEAAVEVPMRLVAAHQAAGSDSSGSSSASLRPDTSVPAQITVYTNVPAYTVVEATAGDTGGADIIDIKFNVSRAPSAKFFSLLVTFVMWALALGVLFIALWVIGRRRKFELAIMSMMAVVLFAMPAALRSFQPGIPPPGVLSDFYGFFPCDIIVALSLVSMLVLYLRRGPD